MRPKIFHVIYNLGRGGAENILVQSLPFLEEYDNYVITFDSRNDFGNQIKAQQVICLDTPKLVQLPRAILKLRRLLKEKNPVIVHSQLTIPNIATRFATPRRTLLFSSVQNSVKHNIEFKKWYMRLLEKISMKFRQGNFFFVAKSAQKDYQDFMKIKPNSSTVLYNFVDTGKFQIKSGPRPKNRPLKLVTVGSLSYQKNFKFLINAIKNSGLAKVSLDIYGDGHLKSQLMDLMGQSGVNINLKGAVENIEVVLPNYDLYVSASLYEGLSLSVLEAMASGVPLLLPDIDSFIEQCGDGALFYRSNDEADFVSKLAYAIEHRGQLALNSAAAYERVHRLFKIEHYIGELKKYYRDAIF